MLIVKRYIFKDTCVMYLIYDEIEWYGVRESIIAFSDVSGFCELSVFLGVDGGEEDEINNGKTSLQVECKSARNCLKTL